MSNGNGHHWSKFWWQDWANDPALRSCTLAAQGLWIRLLCLMHEAVPRGYLLINGKVPTARQLAVITGASLKELQALLAELNEAGVYSHDMAGHIFSRRMVRDTAATEQGRKVGKLGGNPELVKGNGARPTRGVNPPRYPTPLSQEVNPPRYPTGLTPPVNPQETEVESETEPEEEKKASVFKNLTSTSPVLARVAAACDTPQPGTLGSANGEHPGLAAAAAGIARRIAGKLESTGKNPPGKRPRLAVVDTPVRYGPTDPVRTPDEQLIELGHPELVRAAR